MDALQISGKWYISSRRAAKEHGYHADYIGQLVRTGKVKGQKVGRSWYVLADSLSDYLEKEAGVPEPKAAPKKKSAERATAPKKAETKASPPVHEEDEEEEEEAENQVEELQTEVEHEPTPETNIAEIIAPSSVEQPPSLPQRNVQAEPARKEHPLLTYLHDEEPELPAVPPSPIVPRTIEPELRMEQDQGTHIPIHAAVKRFVAFSSRPSPTVVPAPAVHVLPLRGEVAPRPNRKPLIYMTAVGVLAFLCTILLSTAVSSTLTSL